MKELKLVLPNNELSLKEVGLFVRSEHLLKLLHEKELYTDRPFHGCSEAEIKILEQEMGIKLPETYRQYLLAVGHYSGRLFQGTDTNFSQIKELQSETVELLRENNNPVVLPDSTFVFSMHQGYEIRFFKLNEGDNPPVMEWYEGSTKGIIKLYDSFEEFLSDSIYQHTVIRWLD
ncbi:SMI1/KNR4 family protein [Paenibacillus planticolens]|uniref:SMI1/KNR4 family protein n=1 Tax=Paenibacillus planticolens TaxID=2654976 RepID=A0ABX1ZSB2_9BACL|nr:SMI1/KNR4 family protein [Paenibacillus planticolens]NOV02956.1 SMI1/KNR4 family protein [Paenibacillus planticolens]